MQQKILIKALRETWDRYAPSETKKSTGQQPSIHAIVRSLGVLSDTQDYQPIPEDFQFNESLPGSSPALSNKDFSEYDLKTAFPSMSSHEHDIARVPSLVNHASASTMTSRAQSEAASIQSTHTSSMSPLTGSFPFPKTAIPPPPSILGRQQKGPMYCPLPPRPTAAPVKPTRIDSAIEGPDDQTQDVRYTPWNQTWDNKDISATPSFMPTYNMNTNEDRIMNGNTNGNRILNGNTNMNMHMDMNMEYMYDNNMPPAPGADEEWNAWIDEYPEYASLDSVILFSLCSSMSSVLIVKHAVRAIEHHRFKNIR
jgi:hypothetical protein